MAAREDAGGGGDATPNSGAGATPPGGGLVTPAAAAGRAHAAVAAVLGAPAYLPPHLQQFYAASPLGQIPGGGALQYPAPSPFPTNYSATPASTRWSSKPVVARYANNALRFLATALCFVTVVLIPASATVRVRVEGPATAKAKVDPKSNLLDDSAFSCLFGVGIIAGVYSAAQLSKGIWEIAFKCNIIRSREATDYCTFIGDLVLSYLMLSSSSVAALALHLRRKSDIYPQVGPGVWALARASVVTSFLAFLVVASSSVLSGYRLCKRTIW